MVYSAIVKSGSQIYTLKFHYLFHEHQMCLFNVLDIPVLNPSPFHFQDLVSNPYCVLYNFYYFSLENLVSD